MFSIQSRDLNRVQSTHLATRTLGLSVNPDKTGLVVFTRKRKLPGFFEPRLFRKILHCSMSVKYLGVILDSRLTRKEHVDVKVKKAHNNVGL